MASREFHASEFTQRITIRIKGLRTLHLRLWLAAKVFTVGAWIAGCQLEIDTESRLD